MANSFWKIPASEGLPRASVLFLREQAAALTQDTEGLLQGQVGQGLAPPGQFAFTLSIRVPLLNNYIYIVLTITQPPLMYPLKLEAPTLNSEETIENAEQFEAALQRILGSEEIQRVVAALRAQVEVKV